ETRPSPPAPLPLDLLLAGRVGAVSLVQLQHDGRKRPAPRPELLLRLPERFTVFLPPMARGIGHEGDGIAPGENRRLALPEERRGAGGKGEADPPGLLTPRLLRLHCRQRH